MVTQKIINNISVQNYCFSLVLNNNYDINDKNYISVDKGKWLDLNLNQ